MSSSIAQMNQSKASSGYQNDYHRLVSIAGQSTGPDGCAQCVEDAIDDSKIYIFGELLDTVNRLRATWEANEDGVPVLKDKDARIFRTLELFAYGTFTTYLAAPQDFIPLQSHQVSKLRVLTLLSLADSRNKLAYDDIARATNLDASGAQVEELLIDAMNTQVVTSISSPHLVPIISGSMNQRSRELTIQDSLARDVNPATDLPRMIEHLDAWRKNCAATREALVAFDSALEQSAGENNEQQEKMKVKIDEVAKAFQQKVLTSSKSDRGERMGRHGAGYGIMGALLSMGGDYYADGGMSGGGRRAGPGGSKPFRGGHS